jgi:hypothetical protein
MTASTSTIYHVRTRPVFTMEAVALLIVRLMAIAALVCFV